VRIRRWLTAESICAFSAKFQPFRKKGWNNIDATTIIRIAIAKFLIVSPFCSYIGSSNGGAPSVGTACVGSSYAGSSYNGSSSVGPVWWIVICRLIIIYWFIIYWLVKNQVITFIQRVQIFIIIQARCLHRKSYRPVSPYVNNSISIRMGYFAVMLTVNCSPLCSFPGSVSPSISSKVTGFPWKRFFVQVVKYHLRLIPVYIVVLCRQCG